MGPDHLPCLESSEVGGSIDAQLPDADLLRIEAIPEYLEDITMFLATGKCLYDYTSTHKIHLVVHVASYQLITGQTYKMGLEHILRICVLDHGKEDVLWECNSGVARGNVGAKSTARKVLQDGIWWPTLFKDAK